MQPTVSEAVECIEACVAGQVGFFQHFGLKPVTLFGRRLHSIDCQNLFCEVDKYARVAHPQSNLGRRIPRQGRRPNISTKSPLAFDGQHSGMLLSIPTNVSKL
jgi:hypothetical protein